jgi:hypothetical protein
MGINLINNISIIIRILFEITLFQHLGLPSFFSSSYTVFSSKGAFIQSEGAASERVFSRLIPSKENSEISL